MRRGTTTSAQLACQVPLTSVTASHLKTAWCT